MKLTLGFSPCPNDTFIFDAMVHGRIDTEGLDFEYMMADVEELNRKALRNELDITKMSYYAFAFVSKDYAILDSGSALGYRNGPLLVSRRKLENSDVPRSSIAIPGKYTTANMLFSIAWPEAKNKKEYLFSDIEKAIIDGEVDAGLIIHETRFTYFRRGLQKVADLGDFWEKLTGLPIPLGTVVINRRIPPETSMKVNRIIRRSLDYAYHDALASYDFVSKNAREMDSNVMNSHIKLFVNRFSLNLGADGRKSITELFRIAGERGIIPQMNKDIFLTSL
jgi:1,4-dihydroxy-6-naphthoate synthase